MGIKVTEASRRGEVPSINGHMIAQIFETHASRPGIQKILWGAYEIGICDTYWMFSKSPRESYVSLPKGRTIFGDRDELPTDLVLCLKPGSQISSQLPVVYNNGQQSVQLLSAETIVQRMAAPNTISAVEQCLYKFPRRELFTPYLMLPGELGHSGLWQC